MMEEDKTIRAFIALELPVKIIDGLKKIQDELKDGTNKVAWAKPENIHLTLKFLGDIEAYKIDSIARLLEGAAAKSCSFDISVKGVGTFPAAVFSSRRRHTRCYRDWSSDVCSSD